MEYAVQTRGDWELILTTARWAEDRGLVALALPDHYLERGDSPERPAFDHLVHLAALARDGVDARLDLVGIDADQADGLPQPHRGGVGAADRALHRQLGLLGGASTPAQQTTATQSWRVRATHCAPRRMKRPRSAARSGDPPQAARNKARAGRRASRLVMGRWGLR